MDSFVARRVKAVRPARRESQNARTEYAPFHAVLQRFRQNQPLFPQRSRPRWQILLKVGPCEEKRPLTDLVEFSAH
jgi:hypothetical protein